MTYTILDRGQGSTEDLKVPTLVLLTAWWLKMSGRHCQ